MKEIKTIDDLLRYLYNRLYTLKKMRIAFEKFSDALENAKTVSSIETVEDIIIKTIELKNNIGSKYDNKNN